MKNDDVITLEEIRAQIKAREIELEQLHGELDANRTIGRIQARDEALERMCDALQYLENSLGEVQANRNRLDMERGVMVRDLSDSRSKVEMLEAELRSVRLATREVKRQMEAHDPEDTDATPEGTR